MESVHGVTGLTSIEVRRRSELTLVHVAMAREAIGASWMKIRRFTFVHVTGTACDGHVLSGERVFCHGMRWNAESRGLESFDGVTGFAAIAIRRRRELATMHIAMA